MKDMDMRAWLAMNKIVEQFLSKSGLPTKNVHGIEAGATLQARMSQHSPPIHAAMEDELYDENGVPWKERALAVDFKVAAMRLECLLREKFLNERLNGNSNMCLYCQRGVGEDDKGHCFDCPLVIIKELVANVAMFDADT